jgi:hypothetical protein
LLAFQDFKPLKLAMPISISISASRFIPTADIPCNKTGDRAART